jgi:uncharacterized protein (DUF1501 family)
MKLNQVAPGSLASRRLFLRQMGALGGLGVAAPFAMNLAALGSAAAAGATDYKALVCLFMYGGNDSFNMFLPTDTASWTNYTNLRNQAPESIALLAPGTPASTTGAVGSPQRLGGVLPITPATARTAPGGGTQTFALHPSMTALRTLFNTDKRLAVVANVGPLLQPTTKAQYAQESHAKPAKLFSHNDQQNTWQAFAPEGATQGWGGRLADMMVAQNDKPIFSAISAAGNAVWLSGQTVRQYQMSSAGPVKLGVDSTGRIFGSADVGGAMANVVRKARSGSRFEKDVVDLYGRSIDAELALSTALKPASDPLFGTPPTSGAYNAGTDPKLQFDDPVTGTRRFNGLAAQLQMVARAIEARNAAGVGAGRQVFFVSIGGFDTHDYENTQHATLYSQINQALKYFDDALGALNLRNSVTTFTGSDFGRTFTSNGDGTDHGWGSHHLIMGGAVRGGDVYGQVPVLGAKNKTNNNFDSSPDQVGNGALLPSTSVDQYGATLARWFGLSETQLLDVFPNLKNFGSRNLGFMA